MAQQLERACSQVAFSQGAVTRALLLFALYLAPAHVVFAAGNTLTAPDNNSQLVVENAVLKGNTTTVLFWTHPGMTDPNAREACPLNFYTVNLQAGLATASAQPVARGVCGNSTSRAALLDNGDVLIMTKDRLERWRKGEQISKQAFSSLKATGKLGVDTTQADQWYDMSSKGDTVLAIPNRANSGLDVVSLDADSNLRWNLHLDEPGQDLIVKRLWAALGGGALFHIGQLPSDHSRLTAEDFLYLVTADGRLLDPLQISTSDEPDLRTLMEQGQADIQQAFASMGQSNTETIERLSVAVRSDTGFDVLLQRTSKQEGREGHFLLRFEPDSTMQSEFSLTDSIVPFGLDKWTSFYLEGRNLVMVSTVSASQPSVQAGRKKHNQSVISTIDVDRRTTSSRLVPLDLRYLEAAMSAGDAGQQYLENQPGGEPVLLTRLGATPLVVSRGYLSRRQALRLDEGTEDLLAYTEGFDQNQAAMSKQAARDQRNEQRAAVKQQLGVDVAAAAGMAPEQFNALSKKEQQEALLRSGNYEALMAAGMNNPAAAQLSAGQSATAMTPGQTIPGMEGLPPEVAAAMAQAMQAMGGNGLPTLTGTTVPDPTELNTASADFFMPVMDVFSISTGGIVLTGTVKSGRVSVGNSICLVSATTGKHSIKVEGVEMRGGAETAVKGDRPGLRTSSISKSEVKKGDELRSSCATH